MEKQYTKIDENTLEVVTPMVKTMTISEIKTYRQEKVELKARYLLLADEAQNEIDAQDELLTKAEQCGISVD